MVVADNKRVEVHFTVLLTGTDGDGDGDGGGSARANRGPGGGPEFARLSAAVDQLMKAIWMPHRDPGIVGGRSCAERAQVLAAYRHVDCVRRQQALRAAMTAAGGVAFVANGSALPRPTGGWLESWHGFTSAAGRADATALPEAEAGAGAGAEANGSVGADGAPTVADGAAGPSAAVAGGGGASVLVPFMSPDSMAVTLSIVVPILPYVVKIDGEGDDGDGDGAAGGEGEGRTRTVSYRGMLIKQGVTLIAGGGFHGKSTILNALAVGVFDKAPGDGRQFVLTAPDAITLRAEDGRAVRSVDISAFVNSLPKVRQRRARVRVRV